MTRRGRQAEEYLYHHVRQALRGAARSFPADAELPPLRDVGLEHDNFADLLRLAIRFESADTNRRFFTYVIRDDLLQDLPTRTSALVSAIRTQAEGIWSGLVEDRIVERECGELRRQLDQAIRSALSPSLIYDLQATLAEREQHVRRNLLPQRLRRGYRETITAPEYVAPMYWAGYMVLNNAVLQGVIGEDGVRPPVDYAAAEKKGLDLFLANLTPQQKASYEANKFIEVRGGKTGRRYRIHHGRQQNIHELDENGTVVTGWCFLPQGGLVAGDVMLAQKTALELYEDKVLKIANRFTVYRGGGARGFTELVTETLRNYSDALVAEVARDNPLLRRLQRGPERPGEEVVFPLYPQDAVVQEAVASETIRAGDLVRLDLDVEPVEVPPPRPGRIVDVR